LQKHGINDIKSGIKKYIAIYNIFFALFNFTIPDMLHTLTVSSASPILPDITNTLGSSGGEVFFANYKMVAL
jgi:hypothetical protein